MYDNISVLDNNDHELLSGIQPFIPTNIPLPMVMYSCAYTYNILVCIIGSSFMFVYLIIQLIIAHCNYFRITMNFHITTL